MAAQYPLTVFHFQVEWNGSRIGFTEASGLTQELTPIEYREGHSFDYHVTKFPGMRKYNNITLKRGIMQGDNEFTLWLMTVQKDKIERRTITLKLLDETHNPVMIWTVKEAWPCKVEGPSLKSTGNEVAVESIELCHEGLEVLALA